MRKLSVFNSVTLDGVMQAPGRADEDIRGGFASGGWAVPYNDEVLGQFVAEGMADAGPLLLGRRTYEDFYSFWPHQQGNPFTEVLDDTLKYVASTTLRDPEWNNTTVIRGDVARKVSKLKEQVDGEIQVPGSIRLVQGLIENDLVDGIHLMTFPVILGTGRRLFGETTDKKTWKLTESKTVGEGIPITIFNRAA